MQIYFIFTAILFQGLLSSLEASNARSRIMQLPAKLGFDEGNVQSSTVFNHSKTVVCAFDAWSFWRQGDGIFTVSDIDPTLCSQIIYRIVRLDNSTFKIAISDGDLAEEKGWFRQTVALSQRYPHLKVLLSVGGWHEGSATFSAIAADYKKRRIFINSVLETLMKYGFHGLDMAWEYPGYIDRKGTTDDKKHLPLLMKELKESFGKTYMLSMTAAGDTYHAQRAYDLQALSNIVDQFNLRPFDFTGAWDEVAYHHSALTDDRSKQSVSSTVSFYLSNGVPSDKLVVGIPIYGRTMVLTDEPSTLSHNNSNDGLYKFSGLGQPTNKNERFKGEWVGSDILLGYNEICHQINQDNENGWQTYWDNKCMVPFARKNKHWVTFDNPESIQDKVSFIMRNKLKGAMAWTIDTDDFKGTACGNTGDDDNNRDQPGKLVKYPLLRSINYAIASEDKNVDDKLRSEKTQDGKKAKSGSNAKINNICTLTIALFAIVMMAPH